MKQILLEVIDNLTSSEVLEVRCLRPDIVFGSFVNIYTYTCTHAYTHIILESLFKLKILTRRASGGELLRQWLPLQ